MNVARGCVTPWLNHGVVDVEDLTGQGDGDERDLHEAVRRVHAGGLGVDHHEAVRPAAADVEHGGHSSDGWLVPIMGWPDLSSPTAKVPPSTPPEALVLFLRAIAPFSPRGALTTFGDVETQLFTSRWRVSWHCYEEVDGLG